MAGDLEGLDSTMLPRGFNADTEWKWPLSPARELVTLNYGKALKADVRQPGKIPVYGTNGQCGWHDESLATGPGLILGRKGQGPLGVEWCDSNFWVIDTAYYATVLTPNIDLKYLYYLVKYIGLNHLKDGTSNPSLSRDTFGAQLFPVPPLPEQKAIASILGALDDKIELNRRMNATLEAMARALFQSWFVDFDPVRAKLDGRQPAGLAPATAALFPNSFQDSPLGPIPAGWEVGTLEDLLVLQRGFDLPATKRTNGLYPVIAASGPSGYHNECMVRGPGVTTGRSGVLGNVYFVHDDFWPLNTSLWVKQFKRASPAYAFNVLKTLDFRILNAGSAVPTLNRNHAHRLPVVLPPRCIVDAFSELALALMKRERLNDIASDSLSEIRNSLLPELLSGSVSTTQ